MKKYEALKERDPETYERLVNSIYSMITKDNCTDYATLKQRLSLLNETFMMKYGDSDNALFLLNNQPIINEIEDNISEEFFWNAGFVIEALDETTISKALEVSKRVKSGDKEARYYLDYLQYKYLEQKPIEFSNDRVEVDSKVVLYLLSGWRYSGNDFLPELKKLLLTEEDLGSKKGYGRTLTGILMQKPELLEFVKKVEQNPDSFSDELEKFCAENPKLTFRKFTPGATMEASTATGAFIYMQKNGLL